MTKLTIADTNAKISETNSKLEKHEAVCAERWRETIYRIKRLELLILATLFPLSWGWRAFCQNRFFKNTMKIGSKITIGSFATMLTIVVGIWAIEDRYVNAQEMQQSISQVHLRIDVEKKRTLEREYYEFLKLVTLNPENADLKEHLQAINEEKEELEKRIDSRLENN